MIANQNDLQFNNTQCVYESDIMVVSLNSLIMSNKFDDVEDKKNYSLNNNNNDNTNNNKK